MLGHNLAWAWATGFHVWVCSRQGERLTGKLQVTGLPNGASQRAPCGLPRDVGQHCFNTTTEGKVLKVKETDTKTHPFGCQSPQRPGNYRACSPGPFCMVTPILGAGTVPGAEKQAVGDQVELHAAAEKLPEQHGTTLRGLHLCAAATAGLCVRGPRETGSRALWPPGCAGGLQEKVSGLCLHPAKEQEQAAKATQTSVSPSTKQGARRQNN